MTKILGYSNKLVVKAQDMTRTESGLIVSSNQNKPYKTAKVLSVGDEVLSIKEGDTILIPSQADMEIEIKGQKVSIIQMEAVLAIIKETLDA